MTRVNDERKGEELSILIKEIKKIAGFVEIFH
ncbi:hypothetical protein COLO4_00046 [Corchorus olitorius]|uniref:Uncharacterized protein n=1 Tax=Corchorus olitorius TaxID=93759 RepID=A0A1R3L4R2_9ROSI|nr:hypothetical protein COLO4_00046 [Corchorus olitorius]